MLSVGMGLEMPIQGAPFSCDTAMGSEGRGRRRLSLSVLWKPLQLLPQVLPDPWSLQQHPHWPSCLPLLATSDPPSTNPATAFSQGPFLKLVAL